ncbi:hypothetical protein ACFWFX_28730 [Streptomyces roseolus]|uniref:hypothetical protein n=1 Tax=Streptomyces roseolus TaxID=67358 RepID=UPI00366962A5
MTGPSSNPRPRVDQLTDDMLDQLYAERDEARTELENIRRSFPIGVKPALVKTLAAVDGQHYGRLPVAERKRYRDQADAVLRVMGWREKQLEEQLRETLRALRAAEEALDGTA